jgi:predicted transcriptional regulator
MKKENLLLEKWIALASEKEVAILSFPTLDDNYDYLGFTSKNDSALSWCSDLFIYYWDRAEVKHELSFARPYEAK